MNAKNLALVIVTALLVLLTLVLFLKPPIGPTPQPNPNPTTTVEDQVVRVYFAKIIDQQAQLIGLKRQFPIDEDLVLPELRVKWVIKKLLAGPTPYELKAGYYSEIPSNTELLGVSGKDNKLYVNLSHVFSEGAGSETLLNRLGQLQKTLQAIPNNPYPIYLNIDGHPLTVLGSEGLDVEQPIVKPIVDEKIAHQ